MTPPTPINDGGQAEGAMSFVIHAPHPNVGGVDHETWDPCEGKPL